MKRTNNPASFRSHPARILHTMGGGLALIALNVLPIAAHADDTEFPEQTPAIATMQPTTEGKQLLAVTLLLTASLIGMERFCSWRLNALHQRPVGARPTLSECVPPLRSETSSLFSPTPEV